jgi:PfaD family protein
VEGAIDHIHRELPNGPFLCNILHAPRNESYEFELVSLYVRKGVTAIEASAFVNPSPALVCYRVSGLVAAPDGTPIPGNRIIAKVSREEVAEKFMAPPDEALVAELLAKNLIRPEQARMAARIPMADFVTAEADSGGHTDNRPLVSLLPAILVLRDAMTARYGYRMPVGIGAAGGIGPPHAAAAAFQLGADYVVTGSVNQAGVEAGTSDYVKHMLAQATMADVVMAPSADMFETGAKVQVMKKGTMFPMNAQRLYDLYTRFASLDELPDKEIRILEDRLFHQSLASVWALVRQYFTERAPDVLKRAEGDKKAQMALVFRWYLGNASRWAVKGQVDRKMDMQIWCGQSMGAFNKWTAGTALALPENRQVADVNMAIMKGAAQLMAQTMLGQLGE